MSSEDEQYLARPGNFFGVYILYNINPKFKGKIYIGFTVNPERRIRQHNREIKGGAWKTGGNKGPWHMVLITHGFQTRLAALQFEWAWQNPTRSRRLSHLPNKNRKESIFGYRLRILSEMLTTGPWKRLPLTIQWLKQEYMCEFPVTKPPPVHMPIAYGQIRTVKQTSKGFKKPNIGNVIDNKSSQNEHVDCFLCNNKGDDSNNSLLSCIVKSCKFVSHTKCLAYLFLEQSTEKESFLIPVSGTCPECKQSFMWGDILKQKRYSMEVEFGDEEDEDFTGISDDDEFE